MDDEFKLLIHFFQLLIFRTAYFYATLCGYSGDTEENKAIAKIHSLGTFNFEEKEK